MIFLIFIVIALFIIEPRWYNNIYFLAIILLVELLYYTEKYSLIKILASKLSTLRVMCLFLPSYR